MISSNIVMRGCLLICAIGTSASVSAQAPALKGHVIGETVQQFLLASDALTAHLAKCRSVKDQKAARKQDVDWDSCQQLIGAVDNKGSAIVVSDCAGINLKTYARGTPCLEFDGQAEFDEGSLAMMIVTLVDPWANVYKDLVGKFGAASSTGQETFQNGYGAAFYGSNAIWQAADFMMTANEKVESNRYASDGYLRTVTIAIATSGRVAKKMAQETQRKSTLD